MSDKTAHDEQKPASSSGKPASERSEPLSRSLDHTLGRLKEIFNKDATLKIRVIKNSHRDLLRFGLVYIDGMTDLEQIQEGVIRPVTEAMFTGEEQDEREKLMERIRFGVIHSCDVADTSQLEECLNFIVAGKTLFLMDGYSGALAISAQGWETRSITEPQTEKAIRGPREGFTESLLQNLTLIRRRVKDTDLKFIFTETGTRTKTQTCLCYMEGLASPDILKELQERLAKIDIDHILDTGYLAELIRDEPYSPFELIGSTERPDSVVSKMMEGRIAVMIEGSPFVLTLPYVFVENFQVSEDYYLNYYYASFNRILRILGAFLSISIPPIYVALVTFSHEMLPTKLLLSIATARLAVPFPSIAEAFLMLTIFEILREAGSRIPTNIGQAVSIVGALVLGQAAVDARIVSAPMVIVVGLTGITTLLNPKITGPMIVIRAILLVLSFLLGIYGYFFGLLGLLIHLMSLRSFGVSYMLGVGSIRPQDIKDTFIRVPWWDMYLRPVMIGARNIRRKSSPHKARRS